jgi:hypothetical protein
MLVDFLNCGIGFPFFFPSGGLFITKGDIGLKGNLLETFIRDVDRGDLGVWGVKDGVVWFEWSEVLNEKIEASEELLVE